MISAFTIWFASIIIALFGPKSLFVLSLFFHLDDFVFVLVVQNFGSHCEYDFHVFTCFGWGFNEEGDAMFLSKFFCLTEGNFSVFFSIFLVSNQDYDNFWLTLLQDFTVPVLKVQEGVKTSDIVCKYNTVGSSVENLGNGFEWFLSSSIPDLKFKNLLLEFDQEGSEFDSNSNFMVLNKIIGCNSMHQTTFADCWVTDNN